MSTKCVNQLLNQKFSEIKEFFVKIFFRNLFTNILLTILFLLIFYYFEESKLTTQHLKGVKMKIFSKFNYLNATQSFNYFSVLTEK